MTRENPSASHWMPGEPRSCFRIVSEGGLRAGFPAWSDSPLCTGQPGQLLPSERRR